MESTNTLITVITNHGDADDVMTVARSAGAKGGTILNARGTGKENDIHFFGMNLMSEKEMLVIVAEKEEAMNILAAIKMLPLFSKPGGGIVYTTDVKQWLP